MENRCLATDKLRDYAALYGHFVAAIAEGWETLGETHYAQEEREHEALWNDFRAEIGAGTAMTRPHTSTLVTAAKNAFRTEAEAIGTLYAFEAQQPRTSRSKLDGLNEHYLLTDKAKKYFVVHAEDVAERDLLRERAEKLDDREFERAKSACALLCAAMWSALDGIYDAVPASSVRS